MIEASAFPQSDWLVATPESQGVDPGKLDEAMACMEGFTLAEGVSQALVIRNGRMIWSGEDIDNLHPIWSCSKSFTSCCLGMLVDDGAISLDEPVAKYLPELQEHYATATFRHFANFTVGYRSQPTGEGQLAWPFDPAPALFAPGERFIYSMATEELGYAITKIAGETLRDMFKRRIADPIGMDPTQWDWGLWGQIDGLPINGGAGNYAKGIWTTARQIARLGWLFVHRGRWEDTQLLSREWVEEATRPQMDNTVPPHDPEGWYKDLPGSYGLNWWVNGFTPDGTRMWPTAPERTCAIQGNNNNICFVIPEWNMVAVRLGTDGIIDNRLYDRFFEKVQAALIE